MEKLHATWYHFELVFKKPAGTSRGVLHTKDTYIIETVSSNGERGVGECNLFRGLSHDDVPDYVSKLTWLCNHIHLPKEIIIATLNHYPSLICGYEQAMANLAHGGSCYFPSAFTKGEESIKINGLIWMGESSEMIRQIQQKLADNFTCLKLKIGTFWSEELRILQEIRAKFSSEVLEIRVDANGAFSCEEAPSVLDALAKLDIHSIEQPIKAGHWQEMAALCRQTPVPVALDEELIGCNSTEMKRQVLDEIRPQYIILKPALVGGFSGTDEWISLAENRTIGWWITSALESNIGLNALAQYTFSKNSSMPQGLGTGALFTENFQSPLFLQGENLHCNPELLSQKQALQLV